jgi:hypothetical protein
VLGTTAQAIVETTTWDRIVDVATVAGALAGVTVAALVAVMPDAGRPRLSLVEDRDKAHSAVESTPVGGMPYLRVLVANRGGRRAAQNTRVQAEGYPSTRRSATAR